MIMSFKYSSYLFSYNSKYRIYFVFININKNTFKNVNKYQFLNNQS